MKSKFTILIFVAIFLSACGGGGGGDGKKSNTSSTSAVTITANAGPDITVNEGETVSLNPNTSVTNPLGFTSGSGRLEITGSSNKGSDIVKLVWKHLEGPSTGFTTSDTTSGKFSFTAPDTGTADSVQVVYQLTLTNASGQSASDNITITINHVNEAPVAKAGDDLSVESGIEVSLSGTASNDPDGDIKSYAWIQTAGDAISLSNADKATATFVAPTVTETTLYEFELTVTDKDDATAKDKVTITVTPKDAPLVNIYFPTPVGVYKDTTISAFGSAEAVSGNLHKVEVSTGGDFTEVEFNEQGEWRLDDIAVPETDTFEIVVKVTDSLGISSIKKSVLKKSGAQGTGQAWKDIIALGIDNENQRVLAFANGPMLADLRVFPIELISGNRGADISNFSKSTDGVQSSAIVRAYYDKVAKKFYYTISPANSSLNLQLNELDVITGRRKVISESSQQASVLTDVDFVNPAGVTSNQQGQIFVADNGSGKILQIDASTRQRSVIRNLSGAIEVALDPSDVNSLFTMSKATLSYVSKTILDVNPVTTTVVTDSNDSSQGSQIMIASELEVDNQLNKLLIVEGAGLLSEANITTGMRSRFQSILLSGKGYDHERHLFYYNDKVKNAIWVLDPVSKHKVMISGSVD